MTRKDPKRSAKRKEQSERDKSRYLSEHSIYGQAAAFKHWLGLVQSQGMRGNHLPIPFELIDFTASFIASVMHGVTSELILMTSSLTESQSYRENINFIRRTLSKAQISCSSLICSLWYIDQYFFLQQEDLTTINKWNPRDLFLASIIVADKYIADITWLNSDWSEWTHFTYSNQEINRLEQRFLKDIHYKLYISELDYSQFVSYLEFRLHSRQLLVSGGSLLSYRDIDVLSQTLDPAYVRRLKLNLRPFEAMVLLAKHVVSIFIAYMTTTLAVLMTRPYFIDFLKTFLVNEKDNIAMIVVNGIDLFKEESISIGYYEAATSYALNLGFHNITCQ
ncbi:uncharacterized protein BX663DRAFT_495169 [Cokeromyces recurvatus]|uniref:uncharacterized protein n=1 Tax=Cokeromyces recurvatus TaxID=90255 RepID=UPI00221F5909|nr:uncharacterized protein BX663DRAFT_495169 [Cokeromyces recurvatus]KAI7907201.1 hypothetical protein BX663DRAFT_495169 [Cokeromyces recurvatus]